MSNIAILVANSSGARMFVTDKLFGNWSLEKSLDHPESRQKDKSLVSDRLGNFQNAAMSGGSFVEASDPKEFEADRFAKELADLLDQHRKSNNFERFVIVAPPQFYGMLNKHCNSHVKGLVDRHISKDYTRADEVALKSYLRLQ